LCNARRATSGILLNWYDRNARDLLWRVSPAKSREGVRGDPYRVWLSEVMLQQTTVLAVTGYFKAFTTRWPTVFDLAAADDADVMAAWAGLGYYARARNLLKCARVVAGAHKGVFPFDRAGLMALPGIGPYTAAAIAAIAFDLPEVVVDGNVERVMARLFAVETPLPAAKPELVRLATQLTPQQRPGDYAQAVMDLGATVCTARNPACGICPLQARCVAHETKIAAHLPNRSPKPVKPVRRGIAYVARRDDGAWLLERRPDRGLLGGMLGWPGPVWQEIPDSQPPFAADWQVLPGDVRHTFTHFHLILDVYTATLTGNTSHIGAQYIGSDRFRRTDLPTVMRKVYDLAVQYDFAI